ncbi:hypothetical protein [Nitrospirillum viridazoti]|uniref:hypothetical protein n=1 Tax=Nitrospirillum viridazoti TaxID=3144925 RepID=UPI00030B5A30|nr:hypothetical protein [Nitrospirillum amazonense]
MPPALSEALSTPLVTLRETQAVAVSAADTHRLRNGRPLAPQVITGTVAAVDALAILATGLAASALADGTVARPCSAWS